MPASENSSENDAPRWWQRLTFRLILAVIGVLIAAMTGAGAVLGWAVWGEPLWPWSEPAPAPAGRLELIKAALAVVAGLGGAVALTVAYLKQQLSERSEQGALREEMRAQVRAHRDQYGAAAAQLGDDNSAVRLAGVYAMANLADSWPEQRQQCVAVLCAYLRLPWQPSDSEHPIAAKTIAQTDPDQAGITTTYAYPNQAGEEEVRKTILRVIAEHLRDPSDTHETAADLRPGPWSTLQLDFTAATLPKLDWSYTVIPPGASFNATSFTGDVSFRGARFAGPASFDGATFAKDASFPGATFAGGAWFIGVKFAGGAWFLVAQFDGPASFDAAMFAGGAWFTGVEFAEEALFNAATFARDAVFKQAMFAGGAEFEQAKFAGVTQFVEAKFTAAPRFTRATFAGDAVFLDAKFDRGAQFTRATFAGDAVFFNAKFDWGAWFIEVKFTKGALFGGAKFGGAAEFKEAEFIGDTLFGGAKFGGPISKELRPYLTQEQRAHLANATRGRGREGDETSGANP